MLRRDLLNQLLNTQANIHDILSKLDMLGWDSEEEIVILTKQHILNALESYQQGKINENEIEGWANAIETREDIGRESQYRQLLDIIIYELANPFLTQKLSYERVSDILKMLHTPVD